MSWSFSAKGQGKAVKTKVVAEKNYYEGKPEGERVEAARKAALNLVDVVLTGAPWGTMVEVSANGSEGTYGGEMHVSVKRIDVLYDSQEPMPGPMPQM